MTGPAPQDVKGRCLVVEDDDTLRAALAAALSRLGYEPVLASGGEEAIRLTAACEDLALALVDIVMPSPDGIEVIGEIQRGRPDVRIVAMSGGGRVDAEYYLSVAQALGVHSVLRKPFQTADLEAALADGGRLRRRARA